jgi:type IV fimbrial biogenesis protein FimT
MTGRRAGGRARHAAGARGFTLIEMMITLTIAAILLVIGIPSFRDASVGSRLRDIASDLNASVQVARGEAIKRNVPVTLCRSADGAACADDDDWGQGWIILVGAEVLQHHQPVATGYKVERTGGSGDILFQPIGVGASVAEFVVCRADPLAKQQRKVRISATGSVNVTTPPDSTTCP